MIKVYVVGPSKGYARWIEHQLVNTIDEAEVVMFTGGEDINPEIYNEKPHKSVWFNDARDKFEIPVYKEAVKKGKFLLGICRGAQLICAMQPKGKLIQDQSNPGSHIISIEGNKYEINSIHHQAMYPFNMDKDSYKILAYTENESDRHLDGDGNELNPPVECEIVYFKDVKGLGIQFHPEMMKFDSPINQYLRNLLNTYLNK